MATVRVQAERFDIAAEMDRLTHGRSDIGGLGCFVGIVRSGSAERPIAELRLEHYPAMTGPALAAIAEAAERRWPLLGCTLIHRIGTLRPGDPIVLVLAASSHRQAALDATVFLIDWLKTRAPFWKHELFTDGSARWVEARAEDDAAAAGWD